MLLVGFQENFELLEGKHLLEVKLYRDQLIMFSVCRIEAIPLILVLTDSHTMERTVRYSDFRGLFGNHGMQVTRLARGQKGWVG